MLASIPDRSLWNVQPDGAMRIPVNITCQGDPRCLLSCNFCRQVFQYDPREYASGADEFNNAITQLLN